MGQTPVTDLIGSTCKIIKIFTDITLSYFCFSFWLCFLKARSAHLLISVSMSLLIRPCCCELGNSIPQLRMHAENMFSQCNKCVYFVGK